MCNRNTVRGSSHISFFCGGVPFCEVVRRPENTHEELTGLLKWPTGLSLAWDTSGPLPLAWAISGSLPSVQIYRPYIVFFKSHAEVWTSSSYFFSRIFFCFWLVFETYIIPFFPVICWSYLRREISVTLSIGNKSYSLSCETTLLMLSWNCIESAKFIVAS